MSAGYLDATYAASQSEHGTPTLLPRSRGWVLRRAIGGFPYADAAGCYPLFACADWRSLEADLQELAEDDIVALSVVSDPFGDYDVGLLKSCFPDLVRPFKRHLVVDLEQRPEEFVSRHHQRYARRGLRAVDVEQCPEPPALLDDWVRLYSALVARHGISGVPAFSRSSFARQLAVPGIVAFRATYAGRTVGMLLWYVHQDRAYYHLGAYSDLGYELRASFALFWSAIEFFAESGPGWLNLGAGAGTSSAGGDGLTRFKQGWSNAGRTAFLCGRIFDERAYRELAETTPLAASEFFPAYRAGEYARELPARVVGAT